MSTEPAAPAKVAPVGTVHDLGYKRYVGTRRPQGTRWQVIARNQGAYAWKTWWRFKSPMLMAIIATFIAGAVMYVSQNSFIKALTSARGGVTFADGVLPIALTWYFRIAFIFSMTLTASIIATDVGSGAFTFYFARAVRVRDYVIGKLVAMFVATAALTLVGPLLLASLRVGLSENTDEVLRTLPLLGKALIVGVLAALAYSAIPLGISSLFSKRRQAVGMWTSYYLIIGTVFLAIGHDGPDAIAALDIPTALAAISFNLFDVKMRGFNDISLGTAVVVLGAQIAAAIALIAYRVRASASVGVGSS